MINPMNTDNESAMSVRCNSMSGVDEVCDGNKLVRHLLRKKYESRTANGERVMEPKLYAKKMDVVPFMDGLYYVRIKGCLTDFLVKLYWFKDEGGKSQLVSKVLSHDSSEREFYNRIHSMKMSELEKDQDLVWYGVLASIPDRV